MIDHYDHLWLSKYGDIGDETFLMWAHEMRDQQPDRIFEVVEQVIAEANQYPPKLIDFKRMCSELAKPPMYRHVQLPPPYKPKACKARDKCFARARELGVL
jgi:hypothetical protein